MLEIKKVDNEAVSRSLCQKYNVKYSDDLLVFYAFSGQAALGAGFFTYQNDVICLVKIETSSSPDLPLADGIIRAGFFAIENRENQREQSGVISDVLSPDWTIPLIQMGYLVGTKFSLDWFFSQKCASDAAHVAR